MFSNDNSANGRRYMINAECTRTGGFTMWQHTNLSLYQRRQRLDNVCLCKQQSSLSCGLPNSIKHQKYYSYL